MNSSSTLLTDDRIIAITVTIISLLATGFFGLLIYIFKKVMNEIKTYRADSLQQKDEFYNALNNKFKSINYYMRLTDKLQVKHDNNIETFRQHARDTKLKLVGHDEKLGVHGEKLKEHETEIKNLKKAG